MTFTIKLLKSQWPDRRDDVFWTNEDTTTLNWRRTCDCLCDVDEDAIYIAVSEHPEVESCHFYYGNNRRAEKLSLADAVRKLTILKTPTINWDKPIRFVTDELTLCNFLEHDTDGIHTWLYGESKCRSIKVNSRTGFYIEDNSIPELFGLNVVNV